MRKQREITLKSTIAHLVAAEPSGAPISTVEVRNSPRRGGRCLVRAFGGELTSAETWEAAVGLALLACRGVQEFRFWTAVETNAGDSARWRG